MAEDRNDFTEEPEEEMTVTLYLEDGSRQECSILTIFECCGKDYIALLPNEGPGADEGEVYLYRYIEDDDGEPSLANIDDDDEYERVVDAFDELLDDMEFDELEAEEDFTDPEE